MASAFSKFKNAIHQLGAAVFPQRGNGDPTLVPAGYSGIEEDFAAQGPVAVKRDGSRSALAMSRGVVPSARLVFSSQPTAADTITIDGKVFTFVASLGAPAANVQVLIGGSAAATLASFVKAINGTVAPAEWVEATTPFATAILADVVGTSLRIRLATARGGAAKAAVSGSIALLESITAAADIWNCANLNVSGKSEFGAGASAYRLTVTAQMITATGFALELPFTPSAFLWGVTDSTGAPKAGTVITDTMAISGNALIFALAGATHVVAGDVISVVAFE